MPVIDHPTDTTPRTQLRRPAPFGAAHLDYLATELWPLAAAALPLAAATMLTAWCWIPLGITLVLASMRIEELWPLLPGDGPHKPQPVIVRSALTVLAALAIVVALLHAIVEVGRAVVVPAIATLNLPGIAEPVAAALRTWFSATTAGLPVTAGQLATVWATALAITIVGGICGSRGAQLGFGLLAGATVAMVWQGAAIPEQRPALLLAVLAAFAVLAIPVLRRA